MRQIGSNPTWRQAAGWLCGGNTAGLKHSTDNVRVQSVHFESFLVQVWIFGPLKTSTAECFFKTNCMSWVMLLPVDNCWLNDVKWIRCQDSAVNKNANFPIKFIRRTDRKVMQPLIHTHTHTHTCHRKSKVLWETLPMMICYQSPLISLPHVSALPWLTITRVT